MKVSSNGLLHAFTLGAALAAGIAGALRALTTALGSGCFAGP